MKYKWFDCDKCPHSFHSCLNSVIGLNSWCPYCANQKLCNDNDCVFCYNNSFASYDENKVECWSNKNKKQPRDVFKHSGKKYLFKCDECNEDFKSVLSSISNGTWCPICKNKTETKFLEFCFCLNATGSDHSKITESWFRGDHSVFYRVSSAGFLKKNG